MKLLVARPVADSHPITSPFGKERIILGVKGIHHGIDFGVPVGTPVHAMADGRIFRTGWEANKKDHPTDWQRIGLGFRVWQTFTFKAQTFDGWYGHLSDIRVKEGQQIKSGDLIGFSGSTGHVDGPHLHVQFRDMKGAWWDADFAPYDGVNGDSK